jgi:peroxiredoxin
MEAMQEHAKAEGYKMPYLMDKAHRVADAFGALKTPHVYLFNKDMELVYRGSLDDNVSDASAVQANYVMDAMTALKKGKVCDVAETKAIGCSIKRIQ